MRLIVTFLASRFSFAGRSRLLTPGLKRRLAQDLYQARLPFTPAAWFSACFGLALLAAVLSMASASFTSSWLLAVVVVFLLVLAASLRLPHILKRRLAARIESSMPDSLRLIALSLEMGLPFEECLSQTRASGAFGQEMRRVLVDSERGASIPAALASSQRRVDSELFSAALTQLARAYSASGNRAARAVFKSASEAQNVLAHRAKEYSAKLVMYSLAFVGVSAIVPSMLLAFSVIGANFLEPMLSPADLLFLSVVAFPAFDAAILALARWKKP